MALTVRDAIAAATSAQATLPADKVAYIRASVSITDAGTGTISGTGGLARSALLTNLWRFWASDTKFLRQRGGTGPRFLLGLEIQPVFLEDVWLWLQSYIAMPRLYWGEFGLYLQPHF